MHIIKFNAITEFSNIKSIKCIAVWSADFPPTFFFKEGENGSDTKRGQRETKNISQKHDRESGTVDRYLR